MSDAPSEPQGPCLPAGPPELLLRLVREGAAVHAAILRIIADSCNHSAGLRGFSRGCVRGIAGATHRPDAGTAANLLAYARACSSAGGVGGRQLLGLARSARWRPRSASAAGDVSPVGEVAGAAATPTGSRRRRGHGDPAASRPPGDWRRTVRRTDAAPSAQPTLPPASRDRRRPSARPTRAAAPSRLTGYRWPLAHGRITLPFGPTPWGTARRRRQAVPRRDRPGDVLRRPVVAAHDGEGPRRGPPLRRRDRLGRRPDRVLQAARRQAAVDDAADRRGHRRRQRLPEHLRPFQQGRRQAGQTSRPAQFLGYEGRTGRATGCHVHYGLFSPLETATFAVEPAVVKRMKVPRFQIARIDPLLVLPSRPKPPPARSPASPGPTSRSRPDQRRQARRR